MKPNTLTTTLLALLLALSSTAHASDDELSALDVAPLEAKFGIAITGLNSHAVKTRALSSYMKRVGLKAPKFNRVIEALAEAANAANGKTQWPESMGLPENGSMALYGVVHEGKEEVILVMDVEYKKDFTRFMRRSVEDAQYVEAGQKPDRAKTQRDSVKGTDQFIVTLRGREEGQPIWTVRFKNGVAAVSTSRELSKAERKKARRKKSHVLDHVAWSGTPLPPSFAKIKDDNERLSVAFWARPADMQEAGGSGMQEIKALSGIFVAGDEGVSFEADLSLNEGAKPFTKIATPGAEGEAARQAMQDLAAGSPMWTRLSISSSAALDLIKSIAGKNFTKDVKRVRKELGFDPVKDIANVLTGDLLFSCHDGIADCVVAFGVTKSSKAERSMKAVMTAISKQERGVHFEHDRKMVLGAPKGSVFINSTVFEQATNERGRIDAKAERKNLAKLSWGVRPELLIFGISPSGVKRAIKRVAPEGVSWPPLLEEAANPPIGFDDKTTLAGYQLVNDPSTLLRQALAVARHTLPADNWFGITARSADAFMALYDRALSASSVIRGDGLDWTWRTTLKTLPSEGSKGYNPALDKAYQKALVHRYEGRIRASNEAMLKLAEKAPKSLWGQKARAMALSESSLGLMPFIAGLVSAAQEFIGFPRIFSL